MSVCVFIRVKTIQGCPTKTFPGELSTNEVSVPKGLCPKTKKNKVKNGILVVISLASLYISYPAYITSYMLQAHSLGCKVRNGWEKVSFSTNIKYTHTPHHSIHTHHTHHTHTIHTSHHNIHTTHTIHTPHNTHHTQQHTTYTIHTPYTHHTHTTSAWFVDDRCVESYIE